MVDSQLERLQEHVGERLGVALTAVGIIVGACGFLGLLFNEWGFDYYSGWNEITGDWESGYTWSDKGTLSVIAILLGAAIASYGAWRYIKFRRSAIYPKYLTSKRERKIARIEARRAARLQPSLPTLSGQPLPLFKEREVVRTEIVMIKCSYCGTLNDQTAKNCSSCGARI